MKSRELVSLNPEKLLTHPRNMRRFYPVDQVREMANSILAAKGVIEPLIKAICPDEVKQLITEGR